MTDLLLQHKGTKTHFEKNLRALETKVVTKSTVTAMLEMHARHPIESMNRFQQEMKKLAGNVASGEAADEINHAMHDLFVRIDGLNTMLPMMMVGGGSIVVPAISNTKSVSCNAETDIPEMASSRKLLSLEEEEEKIVPPVQTSSASRRSTSFVMELKNTFFSYFPAPEKLSTYTNMVNLIAPKVSLVKPIVHEGRVAESSFTQPLSLLDKVNVARYIYHYASFFTLPWNKVRTLATRERELLIAQQKMLSDLKKTFSMQTNSAAAKSKIFEDQYQFIRKTIVLVSLSITSTLKKNKTTASEYAEILKKIERVKEEMHKLAVQNRELKKLKVKERRKNQVAEVSHDVTTHRLIKRML